MRVQAGSIYGIDDISSLESGYRSVLSGMRICQLYCFMLLFIVLGKFFFFGAQFVMYLLALAISQFSAMAPPTPPEAGALATWWHWTEILFLLNIWFIYYVYSAFRPAWFVIVLCAIALGHNIHVQGSDLLSPDGPDPLMDGGPRMVEASAWYAYAYIAGVLISHVFFLYIAVRGQRTIHALDAGERARLSHYEPGERAGADSLRELVNVPRAIIYSRRKISTALLMVVAGVANFLNYWRVSIAFMIACMTPLFFVIFSPFASLAYEEFASGSSIGAVVLVAGMGLALLVLLAGLMWGLLWFVRVVCRAATRGARNQMRVSLQDIQHVDERAPILFLRSFLNDKVDLVARGFSLEQWLLDAGARTMTLDDLMLRDGTRFGPVVALGNPDDPAPPYGVARGYFSHDTWKEAVAGLCEDAQFIVMVLDATEGVDWEIGHIVRRHYARKTLFLLAAEDIDAGKGRALLVKALSRIDTMWNEDKSAQVQMTDRVFGFEYDATDRIRLLRCDHVSSYSYQVAVRSFMRRRAGLTRHGAADAQGHA